MQQEIQSISLEIYVIQGRRIFPLLPSTVVNNNGTLRGTIKIFHENKFIGATHAGAYYFLRDRMEKYERKSMTLIPRVSALALRVFRARVSERFASRVATRCNLASLHRSYLAFAFCCHVTSRIRLPLSRGR